METVLLAGGSGKIGTLLAQTLIQNGFKVIILTTHKHKIKQSTNQLRYALWDTDNQLITPNTIEQCDYIINLAGAGIADKRWTEKRKALLLNSRVNSCQTICAALKLKQHKVKQVIQGSASGYYGFNTSSEYFTELSANGQDFLSQVCKHWEEAIKPVEDLGIPLTIIRTGIVLSANGGAFKEFSKTLKWGIASILGNGRQLISWIHEEDICGIFLHTLQQQLSGIFNGVAPVSVTNEALTLAIAKEKSKFYVPLKTPATLLKLALGQLSEPLLNSNAVSADKILKSGYTFKYPNITLAIKNLKKEPK